MCGSMFRGLQKGSSRTRVVKKSAEIKSNPTDEKKG